MSVIVQIGGYGTTTLDFKENETVEELLERLKEQEHVSFRVAPVVQETFSGRVLPADEIVVDERLYFLTVTLEKAPKE